MDTKIFLVDNHDFMCQSVKTVLKKHPDLTVVGEAADDRDAVEMVKRLKPDVVIMDIEMPNFNGIDTTCKIVAECPHTRIIALSSDASEGVVKKMFKAGIAAYILKESAFSELIIGIETVVQDQSYLCKHTAAIICYGNAEDGGAR